MANVVTHQVLQPNVFAEKLAENAPKHGINPSKFNDALASQIGRTKE